jgi:Fe-S-cluster containining protein
MPCGELTAADLFVCRQCGDCCKGFGGTYLHPEDIDAISGAIGLAPAEFLARFCRLSGGRPLLAQRPDGYCVFWDAVCTIHAVKPRMCRRWPFIESILVDPANWQIMAAACPGMRTDIPASCVAACVAKVIAAERNPPPAAPRRCVAR